MGLFGRKKRNEKQPEQATDAQSVVHTDPAQDPNMIRVFDSYGRELFITKEEWKKNILPGAIKERWNDPDQLYGLLVQALEDGFGPDLIKAGRQLWRIDTVPARGAVIYSIMLMESDRIGEAERVLTDQIRKHGEEGYVVTNLAKVYSRRGDEEKAKATLWHALELDPNQDNALAWWAAIHNDHGGQNEYLESLRRVAALPGSWRAQIWIARTALEQADKNRALEIYTKVLSVLDPVPADALMQISGDLGNHGHLQDIVTLCAPRFNPELHGIQVGNNLIKAYIDLKDAVSAKRILESLYALQRPDFKEALSCWDLQIDELSGRYGPIEADPELHIGILGFRGPIWAQQKSGFADLLPKKQDTAPAVGFIAASCKMDSAKPRKQRTNREGGYSRSLALFLAEQVHMNTTALGMVLIPIISGDGAFMLPGAPWQVDALTKMANESSPHCRHIVNARLTATGPLWQVDLTIIDASNGKTVGMLDGDFDPDNPEEGLTRLAAKTVDEILRITLVGRAELPAIYQLPAGPHFGWYLAGEEQALAIASASVKEAGNPTLYGERNILDGLVGFCVEEPANPAAHLLLLSTLRWHKLTGSKVYLEYREKAERLFREHRFDEPVKNACALALMKIYAEEEGAI